MARTRTNISIDPKLHKIAKEYARSAHSTDFSGLVTKLLIADMGKAYLPDSTSSPVDGIISTLRRAMDAEDERLPFGPRATKSASSDRALKSKTSGVRRS